MDRIFSRMRASLVGTAALFSEKEGDDLSEKIQKQASARDKLSAHVSQAREVCPLV
jgi:hypothetical protein